MSAQKPHDAGHRQLRRTAIAVTVCAVLAILIYWLPGVSTGTYAPMAQLHNIYSGLRSFDASHGHLPRSVMINETTGTSYSWRVLVYQEHLRHKSLGADGFEVAKCAKAPLDSRLEDDGKRLFQYEPRNGHPANSGEDDFSTYFMAITGRGTAFDPDEIWSLHQLPKDTVLVVRVEESDTHWMQPGDLAVEDLSQSESLERLLANSNGYAVLFADGQSWILSSDLPVGVLKKFFTIEGASANDREKVLKTYRVK